MHVLRGIDRSRYAMDFLVHTTEPAAFDEEIKALGSRIIPLPSPTPGLRYASRFRAAIGDEPVDIVHSHVHHFSGVVLRAAYGAGIPVRIAHSHSDTSSLQSAASLPRRCYLRLSE